MKSGHLTLHDEIILVQEYTVETHFIVYFIFTTQKFTKSKTKIKISSNDRKMGMEGGLDSTNQQYESFATVGEIRVYWRADFRSGSRVLKKVF